jgi:hypothetical protein
LPNKLHTHGSRGKPNTIYLSLFHNAIKFLKMSFRSVAEFTVAVGDGSISIRTYFIIPFYLQSVLAHSANCVKSQIQWHVEECLLALLCN